VYSSRHTNERRKKSAKCAKYSLENVTGLNLYRDRFNGFTVVWMLIF
jgi:hypothetical protein